MKTNFIQALLDYREFLQWNDEDTTDITDQEEAKQALINDLEFIISTNGFGELYDTEKELITLVGGCELCGSIPMTVNCNNANCDYKEQ